MKERHDEDCREDRLADAVRLLAGEVHELRHESNVILKRMTKMENRIMKEIQDYGTANAEKLAAIEAAIDALPVAGIADDVAYLKEVIEGQVGNAALTEEDKATLQAGLDRADALLVKVQTFNAALQALDEATGRPVVIPPTEPRQRA